MARPMVGYTLKEFKPMALKEVNFAVAPTADTPERVKDILSEIFNDVSINLEIENFAILSLNVRLRPICYNFVSTGTVNSLLVTPREVFRNALINNASSIILCHNHPSGDPTPSEADIKVTRELIRGGQILKIDIKDHIILGRPNIPSVGSRGYASLRELGYFYS
jgi:DNA repair protein RadC